MRLEVCFGCGTLDQLSWTKKTHGSFAESRWKKVKILKCRTGCFYWYSGLGHKILVAVELSNVQIGHDHMILAGSPPNFGLCRFDSRKKMQSRKRPADCFYWYSDLGHIILVVGHKTLAGLSQSYGLRHGRFVESRWQKMKNLKRRADCFYWYFDLARKILVAAGL